ncbi:MAG: NADH:ubiquinone reductase (Na(+)-transporting) subunit A [Bacteroidales bacterium]|nr:NADH:ubiquinone reductase (Na(+)-transporting) subunit A [Bacteroidales bacterium]
MNIKINKGLDIPLGGKPERRVVDLRHSATRYAVRPVDVVGFTPRLLVAEGDSVAAGTPLVADKRDPRLFLPAPVGGKVAAIVRGEKRKLLEVVVERSGALSAENGGTRRLDADSPCWWMLRERPFGTIACPDHKPKGIFISLLDTNPLAPDVLFALRDRMHDFEAGLAALAALAPVHVCQPAGADLKVNCAGVSVHTVEGPHPAGNIGTQIAAISPINKGECVWTALAQDVATMGHWLATGLYEPERTVSVGGPAARSPHYYRVLCGSSLSLVSQAQLINPAYPQPAEGGSGHTRIVSGSALGGSATQADGHLGMYDQQLTFLPEGDQYEFMGWLMPGLDKFSFSQTFLSGFLRHAEKLGVPSPAYRFNTNTHGSVRPFLFTGNFERVFPFDIYPMQLIKACMVGDMELQEQLGIYEVEPEDFALCEFIDPSKTDIQTVIREALEALRKEAIA